MNVTIKTIPHDEQRYPTAGDWYWDSAQELIICVSDTGDWRSDMLVALHEFVEVLLCKNDGVSQQAVDDFDKQHLYSDEPGDLPDAPYRDQHSFAIAVERMTCAAMKYAWSEHEHRVESL